MKILLTGANGFFGEIIVERLNQFGHEVDTIDRSPHNTIQADLIEFDKEIDVKYDLIIHAAGKAHTIPRNPSEEKAFYDVNVKGTLNLLTSLIYPPNYFVFISTVSVYGINHGTDIKESHPLSAEDPYGKSKILAESEILKWGSKNNVKTTILRLPLLIGKEPKGNLKAIISGIKKGYYINIGKGDARKSMVLADDVATYIPNVAKHGGIYNLTDGYSPSFKEISDLIADHFSVRKGKHINQQIIKIMASIGSLIESLLKIGLPINLSKYEKMTKSLTFNDDRAKKIGWKPRKVLENKELWL